MILLSQNKNFSLHRTTACMRFRYAPPILLTQHRISEILHPADAGFGTPDHAPPLGEIFNSLLVYLQ